MFCRFLYETGCGKTTFSKHLTVLDLNKHCIYFPEIWTDRKFLITQHTKEWNLVRHNLHK